ncbi:flagellar hook assembly protein FlgD [Nitratireductor thuwali]|uniref:Basal-body rod modification protein FlgD n=1 Tax=Nitratireductor thuwali TaxID=2267699 RepID=A0ABY5MFM2_9HYPH|nr:Basal-body rod modification protein FlgD [Nitratireductor thuwali]
MNVSNVMLDAGAATNPAQSSGQAVDYQSFLKLLVAEMKNQDPTSPMESTDYVAQLATFSQVEQSVQINSKLDQILQASSLSQASGLIGRQITSADESQTGIVKEVRLFSDGVVAVLENGEKVVVGPGVSIR